MTAPRSRKHEVNYRRHRRSLDPKAGCEFCEINDQHEQFVGETAHFKIIKNIFPYSVWDEQDVVDHLMLVPKLHTDSFTIFSPEISVEYVELLSGFEDKGYSFYTRAANSTAKTVVHLHTHLIKLNGKHKRIVLYARKPYIRFAK